MNEKDFIELLNKTTYFAAFSMLSPEFEEAFKNNMHNIKNILEKYGDTYSEETQEWALKLLLRESVDEYVYLVINDIFINCFTDEGVLNAS